MAKRKWIAGWIIFYELIFQAPMLFGDTQLIPSCQRPCDDRCIVCLSGGGDCKSICSANCLDCISRECKGCVHAGIEMPHEEKNLPSNVIEFKPAPKPSPKKAHCDEQKKDMKACKFKEFCVEFAKGSDQNYCLFVEACWDQVSALNVKSCSKAKDSLSCDYSGGIDLNDKVVTKGHCPWSGKKK